MTNGNGSLTFKWLVPILVAVLFAAGGMLIADTKTSIKETQTLAIQNFEKNQAKLDCLAREKLDKDQYYRDIREIKSTLQKIEEKLDKRR